MSIRSWRRALVAGMKGRNPFGWGILGLFFSIITRLF